MGQTVEDADHRIDPDELFRVAIARQQTSSVDCLRLMWGGDVKGEHAAPPPTQAEPPAAGMR